MVGHEAWERNQCKGLKDCGRRFVHCKNANPPSTLETEGGICKFRESIFVDGSNNPNNHSESPTLLRWSRFTVGFPGSSAGKESTCNAGDPGSIPGSGRSSEEGIGYALQYS